jgi:hypothetical protein
LTPPAPLLEQYSPTPGGIPHLGRSLLREVPTGHAPGVNIGARAVRDCQNREDRQTEDPCLSDAVPGGDRNTSLCTPSSCSISFLVGLSASSSSPTARPRCSWAPSPSPPCTNNLRHLQSSIPCLLLSLQFPVIRLPWGSNASRRSSAAWCAAQAVAYGLPASLTPVGSVALLRFILLL